MDSEPDPLAWLEEEQRAQPATRAAFREQLEACDAQLVRIGQTLCDAIMPMTEAFLEADAHRAGELSADPLNVDRRCVRLEDACYLLLARQAPVAGDLRRVVAILRSVADVQRSASLLRHVGESLTWVHPPSMPDELRKTIAELGEVTTEIMCGAVRAWQQHDGLAAVDLNVRDDQTDLLQKDLLTQLYIGQQSVNEAVSVALIARYYERISDHGVELARHVAYYLTGERIGSA